MNTREAEERVVRDILTDLFGQPFDQPLADDVFNAAALRVFTYQYSFNRPYAAFCDRRGRTPSTVEHWTMVPPVPTPAFREVALIAGDAAAAQAVFRTSGTTRGAERRGTHYVADLSLYHASLLHSFDACLLPDGSRPTMISLVPSTVDAPDSSLSHMVDTVMSRRGAPDGVHCATVAHGINENTLRTALRTAEAGAVPVCLIGTSFAFVHWLDALVERGETFHLADGSRLMDTGGYKGRSREVDGAELRAMYRELLGLPEHHCVNEYGMTEMCSQFYDSTLRDATLPDSAPRDSAPHAAPLRDSAPHAAPHSTTRDRDEVRRKLVPPWVRTRVVDPETLEPVADGERGLLQHFDLANAGSVMAIQTEDVGVAMDGGFHLIGRAAGATPRGCSIAMDMLIEAARGRRD